MGIGQTFGRCSRLCVILLAALLTVGCAATRHLEEGEVMLDRVHVSVEGSGESINTSQMRELVRQKGNTRWLSTVRIPLWVYSLAGRDSSWLNRTIRRMGEAPVVYDAGQARLSCDDMQQALHNLGYLDGEVALYARPHRRKVDAVYVLRPGQRYRLRHYARDIRDTLIATQLHLYQGCLDEGGAFSLDGLSRERSQMTAWLQNRGYYRFNKEYITYQASKDSLNHEVDLRLILHPYRAGGEGPDTLHTSYTIRDVSFLGDPIHLRQSVLEENTFIRPGQPYSAADLQETYVHFGRLGAVRYTNVSFESVADTTLLDTRIQVQTRKPSTISFQPEGTNTAGDLGAAASLTYQNRNLFRGSETFSVQLRGAYEAIRGLEGYSNQDYFEYSIETRLTFPRFIMPFLSQRLRRQSMATSEVSLLYDSQDRPEFHRRVMSAGWHYQWRPQAGQSSYRVDLVSLNYVFMPWISETFRREYLDDTTNQNVILRFNYEDLFIMKTGFGYSYNNGRTALKTNIETSGNLLDLLSHTFTGAQNEFGQYKVFDIAFAQYVKADIDFAHRLVGNERDQLVFHVGYGIAYPYGNSRVLPFEKRYFSGGANSVRGWSVRSLGPGRYKDRDGRINFITQTGDMKLDLNLEYRTHLFWKLNAAAFVDAGNIWTLRSYDEQPEGDFRFSRLLDDLAVGYGLGLRLVFDYFILRFDLGMKAINPAFRTEDEAHFPLIHPRFSRDSAFHFAVGLPF